MGSSDEHDLVRSRLDAIARSAGDRASAAPTIPHQADDDPHPWYDPAGTVEPPGPLERLRAARWQTGRGGAGALAAVGVVAVLATLVVVWGDRPVAEPVPPLPAVEVAAPAADPVASRQDTAPDEVVVSVVGLVGKPGLVRVAPGARVADALAAAGGTLDGADLTTLNLAQRLADGDQVVVGASPPVPPASGVSGSGGEGGVGEPGAPPGAGPVNLNTADEATLDALPGVGPVTAAAIVAWRRDNGPFTDVEQLAEVDGIGPARLARLRTLVVV
ncbi:ComEA family DNA-binding protein [Rhodococcus aetherivorans]|uniref:ComEA family DNA-binding protein n=1 Tax=Rhodococcus TaxID=1827 RepID=UPI0002D2240B|nr:MULTISPECIES: ComEA family DNA-binding protein [Rhodococcus]USC13456.1 ComEA family DNA-binding protein [Rhodococcus sp. 11-3]WFS14839.1 ComEA family DNA-binding protein [Rhodococcus aetherivorans]WKW96715.1 ComEA family DNA-binding protein [Rhodococcus aetherivorans]CCW10682.1 Putative competence protein ComEA [Rhodococcus aetherivorans]